MAVYCCVALASTEALAGETVIVVSTDVTATETLDAPLTEPLEAVTVYGPPAVEPAVKRPLPLTVPPPLTVQGNAGCVASALPNWSFAVAVNCCVAPPETVALEGATAMVICVWFTVTLVLLITVKPPESVIVAWKE